MRERVTERRRITVAVTEKTRENAKKKQQGKEDKTDQLAIRDGPQEKEMETAGTPSHEFRPKATSNTNASH